MSRDGCAIICVITRHGSRPPLSKCKWNYSLCHKFSKPCKLLGSHTRISLVTAFVLRWPLLRQRWAWKTPLFAPLADGTVPPSYLISAHHENTWLICHVLLQNLNSPVRFSCSVHSVSLCLWTYESVKCLGERTTWRSSFLGR